MSAPAAWVDAQVLIPDLLRAAPQARAVLDRYGLRGCGGPEGPRETLAFFARAHDVPPPRLLREVRAAVDRPETPPDRRESPGGPGADTIYRPFFQAGIVTVLTLGAAWGAYLLLTFGLRGAFTTAADLHQVNAHGHAQIFGWVGLFVMGFAYQAFPRFKHTALAHPRLAWASLWLMLAGVAGRSVLEPLAGSLPTLAYPAVAAAVLEVIAVVLFAGVIGATWRASGKPLAFYDWYILNALAWFVIQAAYEAVYLAATLSAPGPKELLGLVATWQAPLREIQIHGFALLMILGVSQRVFHNFYGLPAPSPRVSGRALALLNLAIPGEVVGLVLMRTAGYHWAALWFGSVLLMAAAVGMLLRDWRIFSAAAEPDRSLKFLRAAYVWLLVSLAMLVLLPAYLAVAGMGFSHAYYGAARHAITVGFVSLMIVGVAARVVPTLNGIDARRLPALWVPFLLLNFGCALRVAAQTLTDSVPSAFPVAGVSGLFEVLGLAVWGVHLWRLMAGRTRPQADESHPPVVAGEPLVASHRVGDVLDRHPELLETFRSFGFHALANPLLRRTVARHTTIAGACRLLNVDTPRLLDALNARRQQRAGRYSLPVLSSN